MFPYLLKTKQYLVKNNNRIKEYNRINTIHINKNNILNKKKKTVYITTPIFYVNALPHIGHLFSAVLADTLTRWNRFCGNNTFLTTGTDEHGLKIQQTVDKIDTNNKNYLNYCTSISNDFKNLFINGNIQFNDYIRTTEERHKLSVHYFWNELKKRNFIYLGKHKAYYCISDETFLTASQVIDIYDNNNNKIKVSAESGHPIEMIEEDNYKFKLSCFQKPLLNWLNENPDVIYPPSRLNEVKTAINRGLEDISISRLTENLKWAINVPDDENHKIYVWLDALTNYLTTCGYPNNINIQNIWPPDYHVIGKDILKFHAIYWPAFLMANNLPLPKKIIVHAHWTINNIKMSKSLGNVIDPNKLIEKYGVDCIRYYLLRDGGIKNDGNFSEEKIVERYNNDLANTLGNLISRITSPSLLLNEKIPIPCKNDNQCNKRKTVVNQISDLHNKVMKAFEKPEFSEGLEEIMSCLYSVNKYFNDNTPWNLAAIVKKDPTKKNLEEKKKLDDILFISIEAVRISTLLVSPIIPSTAYNILNHLGIPKNCRNLKFASYSYDFIGTAINTKKKFIAFPKLVYKESNNINI